MYFKFMYLVYKVSAKQIKKGLTNAIQVMQ